MKILLIDDIRTAATLRMMGHDHAPTQVVKTYEDGIKALSEDGPFDLLYLDHDLGTDYIDEERGFASNGYGIMCFLEANPQFLPKEIILVTSNPVGRKQMMVVINKLYV